MNTEVTQTKICKKCGRILPIEKFRLVKGQFNNPYYLNQCKECEYKYQRGYLEEKNKIEFIITVLFIKSTVPYVNIIRFIRIYNKLFYYCFSRI